MRTSIAIGTFLVVGASAFGASALDLKGSDTLEVLTKALTGETVVGGLVPPDCGGVGNTPVGTVHYVGTGSGNGENALVAGAQVVAPMSRALGSGFCTAPAALQAQARSIAFALDGLAIVGNTANFSSAANNCNGLAQDCTTATEPTAGLAFSAAKTFTCTDGTAYTVTSFSDVLRLIYAGVNHDGVKNCASPERTCLVNNWGNVFEGACTTGTCTQIRHAFRRNDESGTTDVFLSLLGLPSSKLSLPTTDAFCNSAPVASGGFTNPRSPEPPYVADFQDNDPIRRTCAGNFSTGFEQVCSAGGTLGVVLPIWDAPSISATGTAAGDTAFPTVACAAGKFVAADAPRGPGLSFALCPNGRPAVGGTCKTPATAAGNPNCLNSPGNSFQAEGAVDGRVYNLHLHGADTRYILSNRSVAAVTGPINISSVGAYWRIHSTRTVAGTAAPEVCQQASATQQIGCLVGTASPCSIGYAGREAAQQVGASAFKVGGIDSIDQCVRYLVSPPPAGDAVYPLSRKLYLNSTTGAGPFGTGSDQAKLATCMTTRSIVDPFVTATGFTTLSANPADPLLDDPRTDLCTPVTCAGVTAASCP